MGLGHPHGRIYGWRRGGPIGCSRRTRVVLTATPAQADARVADGIALHLIDGHLGRVTLDELDEAAPFARWDLDVGDLAETLEEAPQFILGHVAGQAADEDGGVVRIRKLVHGLRGPVEAHRRRAHAVHADGSVAHGHAHTRRRTTAQPTGTTPTAAAVLGRRR